MTGAVMGYFGSKHRVADFIVSLMPAHRSYVEPFAGSLSVLANKPPSRFECANDIDENLMVFWRVLRDRTDELERACVLTPHSRTEHALCLALRPDPYDEIEHARRVWVRLAQGRSGQLRRTGWRFHQSSAGVGSGMAGRLTQYVGRFAEVAERIKNVSLECLPALEVIDRYGQDPDALLYVDPPYLGHTRTGSTDGYATEMRDEESHLALLDALRRCRSAVLLSAYPSEIYERELDGWQMHTVGAWTGQGGRRASRVEVVWSNRQDTSPLW